MKKVLFLLFVIILPFYGANNVFGNITKENITFISQNKISEKSKLKLSDNIQNIFLLEETDINFEEDYHSDTYNNDKNNFLDNPNYFLEKWQNYNLKIFTAHYNNNSTIYSHFSGFSNSIYIYIQVLRI